MEFERQILEDVLAECRDDYVGLWSIVRKVKNWKKDASQILSATMSIVDELLRNHDVVAGTFEQATFCIWSQPIESILRKVEGEWRALGRDPDIGEIVWFKSADY